MFEGLSSTRPERLPRATTAAGEARRVGVEIELTGLPEAEVAEVAADVLGGAVDESSPTSYTVSDTALGDIEIILDTRFRTQIEERSPDIGLTLARTVVPVEIVTPPILPEEIVRLDDLREALRRRGAVGTRDGVLLGLGVHLNVAVAGESLGDVMPVLTAFALLEDVLRAERKVDWTRRLLPFTDPYPRALIDGLVDRPPADMTGLMELYLSETPTRNRGLDMLPFFAHLAPERVAQAIPRGKSTSPRPAYHYRLPDCLIDEPDWTLALEWNRWVRIERVAETPELLDALCGAWRQHRGSWTTVRPDWAKTAAAVVDAAFGEPRR